MRPLIGTSTKMNLTSSEAGSYFDALLPRLVGATGCDLFVLPPFTSIWVARERLSGSPIAWGGQDVHPAESGAHTGDVSAAMLVDLGCTYVEVGHSERRRGYGETDGLVAAKVAQILQHGMTPILCVGEPRKEAPEAAIDYVLGQVARGLAHVRPSDLARVVIAYEPVWAIGLGSVTAPPDHVAAVHRAVRRWLNRTGTDGGGIVTAPRVIYGGSVDGTTADELLGADAVDGLFVGRAALDPVQFEVIVGAGQRRAAGSRLKEAPTSTSAHG